MVSPFTAARGGRDARAVGRRPRPAPPLVTGSPARSTGAGVESAVSGALVGRRWRLLARTAASPLSWSSLAVGVGGEHCTGADAQLGVDAGQVAYTILTLTNWPAAIWRSLGRATSRTTASSWAVDRLAGARPAPRASVVARRSTRKEIGVPAGIDHTRTPRRGGHRIHRLAAGQSLHRCVLRLTVRAGRAGPGRGVRRRPAPHPARRRRRGPGPPGRSRLGGGAGSPEGRSPRRVQ